jgi:CheY-like chemotaxis protein
MQLHSEPGAGTVFRVLFPASARPAARPLPQSPSPSDKKLTRGTILVVDDEVAIRDSAKLLLESSGFAVAAAADGREAVHLFRTRPAEFCAVLLDLTMPHMSGAEAFQTLRAVRPDIPILVTSGYSEDEAVRHFEHNGAAGFIQKPYRASQLRLKLDEVLARPT